MNKRVAADIVKKYNDVDTRDEALKAAEEHGYILSIQIENGNQTIFSVNHGDDVFDAHNLEDSPEADNVPDLAPTKDPPVVKTTPAKK